MRINAFGYSRAVRRTAALLLVAPALVLALGAPASAGPEACIGSDSVSISNGGDSCMAADPVKDRYGICTILGCRD